MNSTPPLVGYAVVEADYDPNRDEQIHTFVGIPKQTREDAERELQSKKQAYEEFCEEQNEELYEAKHFSVTELHIDPERLDRMEEDRHETMMSAVSAVGTALLDGEQE